MSYATYEKTEVTKQLLKQNLKSGRMCCCSRDGSFECRNCKLVEQMQAPRESACSNCSLEVEA